MRIFRREPEVLGNRLTTPTTTPTTDAPFSAALLSLDTIAALSP
jgi:hypothetical protein